MKYVEIIAVKKAISIKEIPQDLIEGMKLLNKNKGMTSLVFEKSNDEVRIFTRDELKYNYIINFLEIGNHVDVIDKTKYGKWIQVYDMPKLYPLNAENKKIVNLIVNAYRKGQYKNYSTHKGNSEILEDALEYLQSLKPNNITKKAISEIESLIEFFNNYDDWSAGIDIAPRNFMQTHDGELISLDMVADRELLREMRR